VTASGALSMQRIDVHAGGLHILHSLSFVIHPGELCALIGPSGAGKSTLIKVLLGLRQPDRGEVILSAPPALAGRAGASPLSTPVVGYVPQEDALHTTLTVARALEFAAALRLPGLPAAVRARRIDEVCRQVGLEDRLQVRIGRLSGGQKKRVSVAMELLTGPPVLILDEPTSGLDPGLEARLMGLFSQVARAGRVVMVATHAMESLERCDALLVLVRGHLAYFGRPADAPGFFQTDRFAGIFPQLEKRSPAQWASAWSSSPLSAAFARRPAPPLADRLEPARLASPDRRPAEVVRPAGTADSGDAPSHAAPPTGPPSGDAVANSPRAAAESRLLELKAQLKRDREGT